MESVSRVDHAADLSPIDIVEDIATLQSWDVDRLGEDHIAIAVAGAWATYSVSLAWYDPDETLRMVCTFGLPVQDACAKDFYRGLEAANDRLWLGCFNYWEDDKSVAFRYGLTLRGGAAATVEQVETVVRAAVENCERYYPAFQLIAQNGTSVDDAMAAALLEAAGSA